MTDAQNLMGGVVKSHRFTIEGVEYDVSVLNAQHCYHGCCFAVEWTGRATTMPELFKKFRDFVIRRQQWEKSA